jgi:hypothetical protein
MPLSGLLRRMQKLPTHLILNKVAVRDGETLVTLQRSIRSTKGCVMPSRSASRLPTRATA